MQSTDDTGFENWHDFEVGSRREIIALLRSIGEKHQLVRMLVHGEKDVCVTSVLDVDADNDVVVLDCSIDSEQNRRILGAGRISFETTLDKIRILFAGEGIAATTYDNAPALKIDLPASMIRLQRREFYRMATPVSNPVRAILPLPEALGGGSSGFPLSDISCGGIAIFDNKMMLGQSIGIEYPNCSIDLPGIGMVTATLQVRNTLDMTLLNHKPNRRLGCQFVDISRGNLAMVQRYITRLERERNARIAGLS